MARLLPPTFRAVHGSEAERRFFAHLERGPADWIALHSVGLTRHRRKPWAEADFVVVTPFGVFVIEVKGGAVRRIGGEWWTNDSRLDESPFAQAAGAAAALFEDLADRLPFMRSSVVGSGVAFPQIDFDVSSTDVDAAIVFDARDVGRPIEGYFERLRAFWSARLPGAGRRTIRPLSPADMRAVVDRVAGDFDLVSSLRADVAGVADRMVALTEQQAEMYRGLQDNDRVVVRGGAGTGKTLLAVADARRLAAAGGHVLMVCHSAPLREHIALALEDQPDAEGRVETLTFQGLCGELMTRGRIPDPRTPSMRGKEYWEVERPMAALEACARLDPSPTYDALVVDEAQDLLTGPAKDLLDVLLNGGWSGGVWRLFMDPQQDVFAAANRDTLASITAHAFQFRLTVNCRNTAQIARDTAIASSRLLEETLPIDGPQPVWLRYSDTSQQRKLAAGQLRTWLEGGLRPEQIVILSPRRRENSILAAGLPAGVPARLIDGPVVRPDDGRGVLQFATIAAFKGLEADAVLILDAPDLGVEERSETLYVGMSRAKAALAVLRSERLDAVWERLQVDFGRRLAALLATR